MEINDKALNHANDAVPPFTSSTNTKCGTCGKDFKTPLVALIASGSPVEEYYACPTCLAKVGDLDKESDESIEEKEEVLETKSEAVNEENWTCKHHLGYLKQRQKNADIPEECFTCSKMIDCMCQ
jgi:DNA-directed RNA polymerase subunit RPC12/RpoP